MIFNRESGILLHPTSLPSKYGIGELGSEAYRFVDFLKKSHQKLWQILPLGPVGYGESPYQCFSAFAGNVYLISIERLMEQGLLEEADIDHSITFSRSHVDFARVKSFKEALYKKAFARFEAKAETEAYLLFEKQNRFWLEEFALFMALKDHYGGVAWNQWDKHIAFRKSNAVAHFRLLLSKGIRYHKFLQYVFYEQWMELKTYANSSGIRIIGDLPIFISYDSSDAWARPELFELDEAGNPTKMAGVPPDYFSETGQFWGNPHYRWSEMEKDDFKWWRDRLELLLKAVDIIRIDHFRGFESYWEIPGGEKTAVKGKWVKAPGRRLFQTIRRHMGKMPVIAEDLGFITKEVEALKNEFEFPGMKILQFTFGRGSEERFFPCNYEENSVVYTGTHDNDTTLGWYRKKKIYEPEDLESFKSYFSVCNDIEEKEICRIFIEIAFESKANTAIIPLQDILCLGSEARMNIPNTVGGGNWSWRFEEGSLTEAVASRLKALSLRHHRNEE